MTDQPYAPPQGAEEPSDRRYVVAVVLAAVFGVLGIHHFYLGRILQGLFDLGLSMSAAALFVIGRPAPAMALLAIDVVHTYAVTFQLLVGACRDGQGRLVTYPGQKL